MSDLYASDLSNPWKNANTETPNIYERAKDERIKELERELAEKDARIKELEAQVESEQARFTATRDMLTTRIKELEAVVSMTVDSQGWDGNNDSRWPMFYESARKCLKQESKAREE